VSGPSRDPRGPACVKIRSRVGLGRHQALTHAKALVRARPEWQMDSEKRSGQYTSIHRRGRRGSTRRARGPLTSSSSNSNLTVSPTAKSLNDVPSQRSLRWKKTLRSFVGRMNPWPWPMNSVTIRPELGVPRRSAGRTPAALRAGAVFRTAPRGCTATLITSAVPSADGESGRRRTHRCERASAGLR
jgi:hypothetical protein